jgi:allantoin racemase
MTRICFLNPFGTDSYDALIRETVSPSLPSDTELEIRHLEDSPANIDYFAPLTLGEVAVMRATIEAERDGFDAMVIGCCYDPGLAAARELTTMPVVGALEASLSMTLFFGHRFALVTDHHKAAPKIENLIRQYGFESNCRAVTAIEWFIDDMVNDPDAVARDAYARCSETLERERAEVAVIGCTIVAACYERAALAGAQELRDLAVINPNLMAVKQAQILAELSSVGQYRMSRAGFNEQHAARNPEEAEMIREWLSPAKTAT